MKKVDKKIVLSLLSVLSACIVASFCINFESTLNLFRFIFVFIYIAFITCHIALAFPLGMMVFWSNDYLDDKYFMENLSQKSIIIPWVIKAMIIILLLLVVYFVIPVLITMFYKGTWDFNEGLIGLGHFIRES